MARVAALPLVLLLAVASGASAKDGSKLRPPVSGSLGVVATESPQAASVGRGVLERGGNAVDAAVATVFAMGVARPQSCGIGGGGFMVYRSPEGRTAALDFRETAPRRFGPRTLAKKDLTEEFTGHLTVGVPGTVAGLRAALGRFGTMKWAAAVRPAERMARRGVRVSPALAAGSKENRARLRLFPAARRQYLRKGRALRAGARLRQPVMARTLGLIRRKGARAFYRGRIARLIVRDMRRAGRVKGDRGIMRLRDLRRYRAKWRTPLTGSFRGRQVIAMPPPTSGGIAVIEMLNILEGFDLRGAGQSSANALHWIIEAQKLAFADRGRYVADPDFVRVPTARLIAKDFAATRRARIDPQRAGKYGAGATSRPEESTTHISVVDRRGGAVALTCTIEQEFGSAVVAPGTGFLLNNEMTDFGDAGEANEARPGKRPRSSMSPTIVTENGRPIAVTGGAGGSRIVMGTLLAVLNRVEYGLDLARAVDAERVEAQGVAEGEPVLIEAGRRANPAVLAELRRRGHELKSEGEYAEEGPRIQAAGFRSGTGAAVRDAVSDPRTEAGSLAQRR